MYPGDGAKHLRRFWRCDCDGESHRVRGIEGERALAGWIDGLRPHREIIKLVTGTEAPDTCPWRAYADPVVAAVIDAHGLTDGDNLAPLIRPSTPNVIVDGLLHYRRARTHVEADRRKRERQAREQARNKHPKG